MRLSRSTAVALAAFLPLAIAQTSTDCNPLDKTCPKDTGLNSATFSADFTQGSSAASSFSAADGTTITYGSQGAEYTISESGQAPTVQSDFYIFFGRVDVKMKAAPGTGIVSSIVFESDDLDEIDWEFLGGDTHQVETNFFGKGNTTVYDRAVYYPVSTPQTELHTYSVDWTSERIEWIIDGVTVRTLGYNDPLTIGGKNYPQTPMRVKLGSWCGGCAGEPAGTVTWAGGKTTFNDAPYIMYVESVDIQNYNPADSYEYGDNSGTWQSIKIIKGGDSSSPSGGSNSQATASATASASGSAVASGSNGNKTAPTSSHSVGHIMQTQAAVSKTVKGKSYSMNSASASAENSGHTGSPNSVVGATTEVPGSSPTDGSNPPGSSGSSAAAAGSASASSSVGGTSGASINSAMASSALIGVLFSLLLL